jgi:hypothetical protein
MGWTIVSILRESLSLKSRALSSSGALIRRSHRALKILRDELYTQVLLGLSPVNSLPPGIAAALSSGRRQ